MNIDAAIRSNGIRPSHPGFAQETYRAILRFPVQTSGSPHIAPKPKPAPQLSIFAIFFEAIERRTTTYRLLRFRNIEQDMQLVVLGKFFKKEFLGLGFGLAL